MSNTVTDRTVKPTLWERFLHCLGYEFVVIDKPLITMSVGRCYVCGKRFADTWYGLFEV